MSVSDPCGDELVSPGTPRISGDIISAGAPGGGKIENLRRLRGHRPHKQNRPVSISNHTELTTLSFFVCPSERGFEVTRVCPWTVVTGHSSEPSGVPQLRATRESHWCQPDNGERLNVLGSRGEDHQQSVSINIEIWLTIKIIIMRKQPHPAVTLDHYKHSNTDKLRRAAHRKPD